jgi:hypothetical protein
MRLLTSRAITTAAAAVIALSTITVEPAAAGHRGNDAAALLAFGAIAGTIAAIVIANQHRNRRFHQHHVPAYGGPVHVPHHYGHRRHHHNPHWHYR